MYVLEFHTHVLEEDPRSLLISLSYKDDAETTTLHNIISTMNKMKECIQKHYGFKIHIIVVMTDDRRKR